jgi:AraC-like DNA-binding protein
MIVFPGIPHAYHPDFEIGWDEYWVGFAGNYLDSLAREKVITPDNPVYHIGLQDIVQAHFAAIFERARQHRPLYQLKTSAQVMLLLAEVLSLYRRRKQKSRSERLVERVKFIMREELLSNVSMKELARRLAVSEPYLREVFKSHTDRSPYQYYLHLKINKAKEYLVYHDSSIKEIAHRLSFEDQYYFSRLFKKKTGISPSQWSLGHDDV